MLRLFQTVSSKKHVPLSVISSSSRHYNFQTKIYTDKFNSTQIPEAELKSDLENFKSKRNLQPNLYRFIKAYHQNGHKLGNIDPLGAKSQQSEFSELNPEYYDLKRDSAVYATEGLVNSQNSSMTLAEIETYLKRTYSDKMTVEFDFVGSEVEKEWIAREFEAMQVQEVDKADKIELVKLLLKSQVRFFSNLSPVNIIHFNSFSIFFLN